MNEAPCIRVARIRCETPRDFRAMRSHCIEHPSFAGARTGLMGEFFVTNEEFFAVTKKVFGAVEF